jgi:preprotein translocase subunit SecG
MMTLIVGLLTVLLVVDCLLLILLVLVQLPKKEAGAGMAFGGAATDALFGAGSGNALTKITKWVAGAFFVLALTLSLIKGRQAKSGSAVEEALRKQAATKPAPAAAVTTPPAKTQEAPMLLTNPIVATNLPAATNK